MSNYFRGKRFLIYLTIGIISLILNTTLLQPILPQGILPDFILIMVCYLGFHRRSIEGVVTSFFLGFVTDTFLSGVIGTTSFGLIFVFAITNMLSKKMTLDAVPIKVGGTFIMALLKANLVYAVLRILLFDKDVPFYAFAVPTAITTALVSPLVFNLLDRIEKFAVKKEAFLRE